MLRPKNNSYKVSDNDKKNSRGSKIRNPPTPDNISNNPSLKKIVPASVVAISNYNLYRRDRNWFDNDKREKGGVEIYVRKNLKVKRVVRSYFFESISLENDLPSGHRMLTCGIYQPNSKYPE